MAILWDAPLVSAVAGELSGRLAGARLRGFFLDHPARNLLLFFREETLVVRLHPLRGEITLHPPSEEMPDETRPLSAKLRAVHGPPDERLLVFRAMPVRSGREPIDLVVELLPNRWNAVVVEAHSRTIRHVLRPGVSGTRKLVPGGIYEEPEPSVREGATEPISLERWLELLLPLEPSERKGTLLRHIAHTSSLNAPALLGETLATSRDGAAGEPPGSAAAREALSRGREVWLRLSGHAPGGPLPVILHTPKGPHPYPVPLPHLESESCDSLLEAFERAAASGGGALEAALIPSGLLGEIEEGVRQAEKRVAQLKGQLDKAPDPAPMRAIGDLLLARFGEIRRGAEEVTLEGFDGTEVTIRLDPTLQPHQNAATYYDEAARAARAREVVPELIRKAEERVEELNALLLEARSVTGEGVNLGALQERVEAAMPIRRKRQGKGVEGGVSVLPYRLFRSSGGLEIRVGRGSKSNDDLTFHHSSPDDIWLHARHSAGAHVILRWTSPENPPARDLYEAGVLAALHSKARTSGSAPVDWTRRKYVRKPRKSPPGAVLPSRVSTLFVEPDPALGARLAVS